MARKQMSEAPDSGNVVTKPGEYVCMIHKVEEKTTSNGNTQYLITLKTDEGVIFDRVTMLEKSLGFVKRYLSACEYDIDDLEYEVDEESGQVSALYMENDEYTLDQLLEEESVKITCVAGDSSYRDPATGDTVVVDNPSVKVKTVTSVNA